MSPVKLEEGAMRTLRRMGIGIAATLGLVVPIVAGLTSVDAVRDPFEAIGVDRVVGPVPAPDLAFRSLDGREVRLGDLRGKVVLLGFFSTD